MMPVSKERLVFIGTCLGQHNSICILLDTVDAFQATMEFHLQVAEGVVHTICRCAPEESKRSHRVACMDSDNNAVPLAGAGKVSLWCLPEDLLSARKFGEARSATTASLQSS